MKYLKTILEAVVPEKDRRKFIEDFYTHRCRKDYNHPDSVGWVNSKSQRIRFNVFLKYIKNDSSVLDYGCGVGDLFGYLTSKRKNIEYLGVDIQSKMISNSKSKYPDGEFKVVNDIVDVTGEYDWIVASGVFTVGMNHVGVLNYFRTAYEKCNIGVIANFIISNKTRISSHEDQELNGKRLSYTYYNPLLLKRYLENSLKLKFDIVTGYSSKDFTLVLKK